MKKILNKGNNLNVKDLPTQIYLQECFEYIENTGDLIWKERPRYHFETESGMKIANNKCGKIANSIDVCGYIRIKLEGSCYKAHRLIWKLYYGIEPIGIIDHINGVRTDNRICNLREATYQENVRNKLNLNRKANSGYQGIYYRAKNNKYKVTISQDNVNIHIGEFEDLNEARVRRVLLQKSLHKEFYAKTDDIEDTEYYKNYVNNLTEEQLKEYTTIPLNNKCVESKNNITGYRGVVKHYNRYRSMVNGKCIGTFNTPEEAALARENKLKELKSINTTET